MKNLMIMAAGTLASVGIDYAAFSFIAWNWDAGAWSEYMRAWAAAIALFFAVLGAALSAIAVAEYS